MALPQAVLAFLDDNAQRAGAAPPRANDDLFKPCVLDRFALVDFLTVPEKHANVKVPDSDLHPAIFQTIEPIQLYVHERRAQSL